MNIFRNRTVIGVLCILLALIIRVFSSCNVKVIATAINNECKNYSAKTIENRWRFIAQVLEWATGERFESGLPQVIVDPPEFLDQWELETFLKSIKGKKVEVAALLAISSLRRSEIAALDWDRNDIDLEHRWIHVRGAIVRNKHNKLVRKETNKNSVSRRDVPIIDPLYKALMETENKHGRVVPVHPGTIRCQINKACRDAGVPVVGCHGLRQSFASLCRILEIPAQVAWRSVVGQTGLQWIVFTPMFPKGTKTATRTSSRLTLKLQKKQKKSPRKKKRISSDVSI